MPCGLRLLGHAGTLLPDIGKGVEHHADDDQGSEHFEEGEALLILLFHCALTMLTMVPVGMVAGTATPLG